MVSHNPAEFNCHRYCSSGDVMVLVGHVISQNLVIKGSFQSPLWQVLTQTSLVVIDSAVVELCF